MRYHYRVRYKDSKMPLTLDAHRVHIHIILEFPAHHVIPKAIAQLGHIGPPQSTRDSIIIIITVNEAVQGMKENTKKEMGF